MTEVFIKMSFNLFKFYSLKLVFRIIVLTVAIIIYLNDKSSLAIANMTFNNGFKFIHFVWFILFGAISWKFFPKGLMSVGCRKQFKSNYMASEKQPTTDEVKSWIKAENSAAKKILAIWVAGNVIVALLFHWNLIGQSELLLLTLFYYVCDLIGVVLFCPLQLFIMRNRCCVTCRIFNWDAMMICTPLICVKGFFSWSLVLPALILLIWWEFAFWRHPFRFFAGCNVNLSCADCKEKLCTVKKGFVRRLQVTQREWREKAG